MPRHHQLDGARREQQEPESRRDAQALARAAGMHLEGLGGSEDGVIGALAAVGLAATGDDGRVVLFVRRAGTPPGTHDWIAEKLP